MQATSGRSRLIGAALMGLISVAGVAQGRTLGAGDYSRAERFMSYNAVPLVDHAVSKVLLRKL